MLNTTGIFEIEKTYAYLTDHKESSAINILEKMKAAIKQKKWRSVELVWEPLVLNGQTTITLNLL